MCVYLATDLCLFAINEEFHYDKRLSFFFLPVGATEFWQHLIITEILHHWGFRIANKV